MKDRAEWVYSEQWGWCIEVQPPRRRLVRLALAWSAWLLAWFVAGALVMLQLLYAGL